MKRATKTTKVLLMLALAFFIAGAALGIASLSAGFSYREFAQDVEDGRFNLIGPRKWVREMQDALSGAAGSGTQFEQTYTGVRSLELNVGRADCEIFLYDGQEWKVEGEHLTSRFDCSLDGEELCVDCGGSAWNFPGIRGNSAAKLKIYVPRDQVLEEVSIEAGVGTVRTSGEKGFLKCRYLDMECGVGETDIRVDVRETARIEGGVGKIHMTLAGDPDDFNYDVECGVGGIEIDGEGYSGLGQDYRIDNVAGKNLRVECRVGSVKLMFEEDDV